MRVMKKATIICCSVWLALLAVTARGDSPRLVVDSGGHTSLIHDVIFTRDGKYLVSAGSDKTIRVWDPASGRMIRTIRGWIGSGDYGKIHAIALSPDDRYLAVGGFMGLPTKHQGGRGGGGGDTYEKVNAIRIFDFYTGELLRTLEGSDDFVTELAFAPGGDYLVSGDTGGHVCVWTVTPARMRRFLRFNKHERAIKNIQVSSDGKLVGSLSYDGVLKLWSLTTATVVKSVSRQKSFAFSPDGLHIMSGTDDNRLLVLGARDGEFERELTRLDATIDSLSYTSDSKRVVASAGSASQVLQSDSGDVLATLKGNDDQIVATGTAPAGTIVASALRNSNDILLWNGADGSILKRLGGSGAPVFSVGFAEDGRAVAFGNESAYKRLNDRGPLRRGFRFAEGDSYQVSFESRLGGERGFIRAAAANSDYALKPKDSSPSDILQILRNGQPYGQITTDSPYSCYTFTSDGRYVAIGTYNGNIEVYKRESPRLAFIMGRKDHDLVGHTDAVWAVASSPDGRTLISGSADQTLRLWDIESGKNILTMFVGADGEWAAWTPDGYYASSRGGEKYLGWHANRGIERSADYYPAAQYQRQYRRPDIVADYLKSHDMKAALRQANKTLANRPEPALEPAEAEAAAPSPVVETTTIVPPVVVFISPEGKESVVADESLTVKVRAIAAVNTPPVAEVKLFLNGVQVGSNKDGGPDLSIEVPVLLQPGTNTLSAVAQSESDKIQTTVIKVTFTGRRRVQSKPNLRILAIGISKYKDPTLGLKFADKDAVDFEAVWKEQGRLHLLFNKVESKVILNEDATRQAIIDNLNWLSNPAEVMPGDVLLLFLSGHGGLSQNGYYFYSRDHDPKADPERDDVRGNIIMERLTRVSMTKPILFVDTCRAGAAAGEGRLKGDESIVRALRDLRNDFRGVVFFAASREDEQSLELDRLQHGAFTYALLEGLGGKADLLKVDRIIYVNELGNWIRERVRELTDEHQHGTYEEPPPNFQPFPIFVLPQ